jgi:transcription factor E2F7/8
VIFFVGIKQFPNVFYSWTYTADCTTQHVHEPRRARAGLLEPALKGESQPKYNFENAPPPRAPNRNHSNGLAALSSSPFQTPQISRINKSSKFSLISLLPLHIQATDRAAMDEAAADAAPEAPPAAAPQPPPYQPLRLLLEGAGGSVGAAAKACRHHAYSRKQKSLGLLCSK